MFGIKWHWGSKDGGAESHVWAYGLEIKWLFSVLALRFEDGSRDAFHDHAFNAVSWVLSGRLNEHQREESPGVQVNNYVPHPAGWRPILTLRSTLHRVRSTGRSWVLSFRGPWAETWREVLPCDVHAPPGQHNPIGGRTVTLTHGRRELHY